MKSLRKANFSTKKFYEAVIVGAGPVGLSLASALS